MVLVGLAFATEPADADPFTPCLDYNTPEIVAVK
jgi:hypothetical protein